jgi:hypothetical protein
MRVVFLTYSDNHNDIEIFDDVREAAAYCGKDKTKSTYLKLVELE